MNRRPLESGQYWGMSMTARIFSAVRHLGPTMGEQHPATRAALRLAASTQTAGR